MKNTTLKNKKFIVIFISFLAILVSALSFGFSQKVAYANENTIIYCRNAADIVKLSKKEYDNESFNSNYEPIGIGKAILKNGDKYTEVYLVTLLGTKFAYDDTGWQATDIINDVLAGFDCGNPYFTNVKNRMFEKIPYGSKILMNGHSLGGMVAQEIIADEDVKSAYEIVNTLTFGSPLCAYDLNRAGNVIRLCDSWDPIPLLSKYTLTNYEKQFFEKERFSEDGGYGFFSMVSAHCYSYSRSEVWGKYDALGILGGNNEIIVDYTQIEYFPAPMFG